MAQLLVVSFLLSTLGFIAYLFYLKPHLKPLQRKYALLGILFLSLALPHVSEVPDWYVSAEQDRYEAAVKRFTSQLNVVDINDPELVSCYEAAENSGDFCHCEVLQKANLVVFKPHPVYSFIIEYGYWVLLGFALISVIMLLELLIKLLYLVWLVRSSRREKIRFGGVYYTLLYPAKPFPVSSFSLWRKYIVWSETLDALPEDQRQAIMLHETAHLLHKDTWLGIFLELIKSVWWLNPVFYYIRAELNLISEILADQYTVAHTGDAKSYAVLLVSMKEKQINTLARQLGGSILKHRVVQLLDPKETKAPRGFKLYLLFTGALLWAVSVFAVPAIENHVRLIKEYEILQHEHAKTGKAYFCKACLLETLRKGG